MGKGGVVVGAVRLGARALEESGAKAVGAAVDVERRQVQELLKVKTLHCGLLVFLTHTHTHRTHKRFREQKQ